MKLARKLRTAVFELTLACPCRCETCGSKAGRARSHELSTTEWLALVRDLVRLGCRRLTLMGGEPLLRRDWSEIATAAVQSGLSVELVTSGIGVDEEVARQMFEIGLVSVTVSVDGTLEVHDSLRKLNGCYDQALTAIRILDKMGLRVGVNSQINQTNLEALDALAPELEDAGAMGWQLQLTAPTGRAEARPDLTIEPALMPEVYQTIKRLQRRRGLRPFITDNIGYLTADDPVLRTPMGTMERCWLGCFAGLRGVGIASDGGVRGCLALPETMTEGNVRDEPLSLIWNDDDRFSYNRSFNVSSLSGPCADCGFAELCRGGCTAFAVAAHGKLGTSTHCLRCL